LIKVDEKYLRQLLLYAGFAKAKGFLGSNTISHAGKQQ
jgi:hypothetical protein